jgi:hypothetical protein
MRNREGTLHGRRKVRGIPNVADSNFHREMGKALCSLCGASNKCADLPTFFCEKAASVTSDESSGAGHNYAPPASRRAELQCEWFFRDCTAPADRRGWIEHYLLFAARGGVSRCAAYDDAIEQQKHTHGKQDVRPPRRVERERPHAPYREHHYRYYNA